MKLFEELKWRGLIKDITNEKEIERLLNEEKVTFYWGTDPSGDSLHLGHFSSLLLAKRLKDAGHHPILLVGGATGLVGDPKETTERKMIDKEEVENNYKALKKQIEDLFGYEMVNNYDWSKNINFIEFLRDYGKYFGVNYMLDKDIVRRRLETGITYTEFSYMIMQALDFLWLYENKNCILQVEGSDQWGNITAGVDLIRKKLGKEAYGFTMPLVVDKDGNKFGKSEGNALWIDKEKTSSYEVYQYLVNTDDSIVIDYLKIFTFLSKEEIEEYESKVKNNPEKREAGKRLAYEVVKFIHGEDAAKEARDTSEKVFSGEITDNMPTIEIENDPNILSILINSGLTPSKSEARRLIEQGGISVDNEKILDVDTDIMKNNFILQKGKKTIVKIIMK